MIIFPHRMNKLNNVHFEFCANWIVNDIPYCEENLLIILVWISEEIGDKLENIPPKNPSKSTAWYCHHTNEHHANNDPKKC